ncbi:MAG: tetratricopeptide repeat protein [Bacteroidales bacterium]|jgi:tetratricopeptide (TPR) repeat protein|nr:tetratricopeptide repeat protein [Bacteroidales bacterium]
MRTVRALPIIALSLLPLLVSAQGTYELLLRSKALTASGKNAEAIGILSSSADLPNDVRLLTARADAKLMNGDISGAIEDYTSAGKIRLNSGEYGLARSYARKGDPATSLYHLEACLRSELRRSEKEILLDPAFEKIENSPEWRMFWKKEWYSSLERQMSEIEYLARSGKTGEASSILQEIEKNYNGIETAYARALVSMSAGKFAEASALLSGLVNREPGNEKFLRTLASAQSSASNYAGASASYTRLIDAETVDPELFLLRAECYNATGEFQKAGSDVEKYLSFIPDSRKALSLAGKISSAAGNNLGAIRYFTENIRLHPGDPKCYIERADSYFVSKSWQWAINDYSMSLDLDPSNSDAWLNKGIALANQGRTEDACHDLQKSFAMGNRRAAEYISRYCIK